MKSFRVSVKKLIVAVMFMGLAQVSFGNEHNEFESAGIKHEPVFYASTTESLITVDLSAVK